MVDTLVNNLSVYSIRSRDLCGVNQTSSVEVFFFICVWTIVNFFNEYSKCSIVALTESDNKKDRVNLRCCTIVLLFFHSVNTY